MKQLINFYQQEINLYLKCLKQPGFTYTACGPFTKNKERIQKYGDFKDIARRTASNKILRDKAFNIAKNPKYDG